MIGRLEFTIQYLSRHPRNRTVLNVIKIVKSVIYTSIMTSLGEVQRIIGLSLSKIQMGRNQRGGLPLHKNLLVATVLNKARDVYMQETMYMNYRLMASMSLLMYSLALLTFCTFVSILAYTFMQ